MLGAIVESTHSVHGVTDTGKAAVTYKQLPTVCACVCVCVCVCVHIQQHELCMMAKCSQLPEGAKTRLAARLTPQMVPPGHDLCQEGDDADCLWILQEGMLPLLLRCCGTVEALPLHMHASLHVCFIPKSC